MYIPSTHNWVKICPDTVDPSLFTPVTQKSIYMINQRNDDNEGMHFEVVISMLPWVQYVWFSASNNTVRRGHLNAILEFVALQFLTG